MSHSIPVPTRPGCLTEEEVAQVRAATDPVPEGLVRHLATCARCQERALFGALRPTRKRRDGPVIPTPTRALILLVVMVAVIVAFFVTLQKLVPVP